MTPTKELKLLHSLRAYILKGYGTCPKPDGLPFLTPGRCSACDANEVVKWLDNEIETVELMK